MGEIFKLPINSSLRSNNDLAVNIADLTLRNQ